MIEKQIQTTKKAPITEQVLKRIEQMRKEQGIQLSPTYNAANALNAAYLTLQKVQDRNHRSALEVCTPASISKSLLDMVLQQLSPAKDQCYFIVYGNELQMQRSYFGTVAAVKRLKGVNDVKAYVMHEGDEFEEDTNENMEVIVSKFKPKFENQDNPIKGAYAIIETDHGNDFTIMTIKEIRQSWAQTRQRNNRVQQNFSQEMAKRTVLNRAAKMFINTSDDSDLLTGAINDTTSNEFDDEVEGPKDITETAQTEDDANALMEAATEPEQKPAEKSKPEESKKEEGETHVNSDSKEAGKAEEAKPEETARAQQGKLL